MLIKDFYTIECSSVDADNNFNYSIKLNPEHNIYQGHFPDKHITPGVCNIQIIKECAEVALSKSLTLKTIDRCRLTAMVTPNDTPNFNVKIAFDKNNPLKMDASIFKDEVVFMTLSGVLVEK
ncbi:MAG: hypothetical protein MJ211_13785 [Bacteroidales bacterium]|nr:hypothetical protein [Bacteroidales bacterium]